MYQDAILVTGKRDEDHSLSLATVLQRLEDQGLRVKKKKCSFFVPSLTYLSHTIDSHGIHTLSDRLEGVMKTPIPTNLSQLRSFLGSINYYG